MRKTLFICTSGKDRSPALEKYFRQVYPNNEYRSAGVNKYFTSKNGTHYVTQEDIDWAYFIVFAEDIHARIISEMFSLQLKFRDDIDTQLKFINDKSVIGMPCVILNCGEYSQGCIGEDYLMKAEIKLRKYLIT